MVKLEVEMQKTKKRIKKRKRRRTKIGERIRDAPRKRQSENRPKKATQGDTGSSTTVKGRKKNESEKRRWPKKPGRGPKSMRGNSRRSVPKETGSGRRPSASADRRKSRKEGSKPKKGSVSKLKKLEGKRR